MRVKLNIIQGQRERHAGHAGILPATRYHGVSIEDLASDCIDFRLRNGRRFSFSLRHFAFSPCSPAKSFSHFWASMAFYGFLSLLLLP